MYELDLSYDFMFTCLNKSWKHWYKKKENY